MFWTYLNGGNVLIYLYIIQNYYTFRRLSGIIEWITVVLVKYMSHNPTMTTNKYDSNALTFSNSHWNVTNNNA